MVILGMVNELMKLGRLVDHGIFEASNPYFLCPKNFGLQKFQPSTAPHDLQRLGGFRLGDFGSWQPQLIRSVAADPM